MGCDSSSECRGFESMHCILDGYFFTLICCLKFYCLKKTENDQKGGRGWPIFNKNNQYHVGFILKTSRLLGLSSLTTRLPSKYYIHVIIDGRHVFTSNLFSKQKSNYLTIILYIQLVRLMDHRVFRFATRWQCIKGKQC